MSSPGEFIDSISYADEEAVEDLRTLARKFEAKFGTRNPNVDVRVEMLASFAEQLVRSLVNELLAQQSALNDWLCCGGLDVSDKVKYDMLIREDAILKRLREFGLTEATKETRDV